MSDVWQGPGWWLASDGKWYPADAEPGAVYEGELQNTSPAVDVVDPPAAAPVAPEPEPVVAAAPPSATPPATEPAPPAPEPVAAQPVLPADSAPPADAAFGADPFAQMPAPVVEQPKVGGWQSVDPAPAPAVPPTPEEVVAAPEVAPIPQPTVPVHPAPVPTAPVSDSVPPAPTVEDDGWTSAYEERQDGPDVQIPDVQIPDVQIPDVQIPDVQIPEVQIPDVQIPDVQIPDVQIPDVQIPEVQIPELTTNPVPVVDIPDVQVPSPATPILPIPDTHIPEVPAPDLGVPEAPPVEISEVAAPVSDIPATPQPPKNPGDPAVVRDAVIPIERDDAWRKPSMGDDSAIRPATPSPAAHVGVPNVVDLAIPEDPPPHVPEPEGRRWGLVGAAIVGLLVIGALAWLISSLFNDDNDVSTTEPNDSTSVTEPNDEDGDEPVTSDATAPSVADTATTDEDAEENQDVSVFALRAGDCIVGDIGAGQVTKVAKVDCEEAHQFEVYREALIESSITSFDEEAISAYAEEVCRTSLEAYIPPEDERGLKFKFLQPTEDSWNQAEDPDRVITCLLFDDDAPLVGRAGP